MTNNQINFNTSFLLGSLHGSLARILECEDNDRAVKMLRELFVDLSKDIDELYYKAKASNPQP